VSDLADTAAAFAERWGAARLQTVVDRIAVGASREALIAQAANAELADATRTLVDTFGALGRPSGEAVALVRGVAAGFERGSGAAGVEVVWSGPSSHRVPVRATAQVLTDLVRGAQHDLVLMTYSAKPYQPLLDALAQAAMRGVVVTVIVETLQGAGGAISGTEPAAAFRDSKAQLWHWPVARRSEPDAKMHAKIAIADRRVLFVSSANLTQSGVGKNVEAGLLVRGGTAPLRAAEHVAELQASGVLARLRIGEASP